MTAVTFPLRPPCLAFAICGWRWQNDVHEIKYSVRLNCPVHWKTFGTLRSEDGDGSENVTEKVN